MPPSLSRYIVLLYKNFSIFCNKRLQDCGLSQGLLYFILYIGKHPGCSPGEISKNLHFDFGHTQRSLNKLVDAGFVLREKSISDKRAYVLSLSETGQQAFADSHEMLFEWDNKLLDGVSPEDQAQLLALLEKIIYKNGEF